MLIFLAILMAQILVTRVPVNHLLHYMHDKQDLQAWSAVVSLGILALLFWWRRRSWRRLRSGPSCHTDSWVNEGCRASFWVLRAASRRSLPWFWP
jgi:hypothetical protein